MASGGGECGKIRGGVSPAAGEDSSESEPETTQTQHSFHRRLSTNREIKRSASLKEGYLLKKKSYQRWRRRYFKLKGRTLYYAKDTKAVIFDRIELTDLCLAECSIKNINHSFQVTTPFRSLVLCAESRREMEDWLAALNAASKQRYHEPDQLESLSGEHHWIADKIRGMIYCNICRELLRSVINLCLTCDVCDMKVHKKCAEKTINNCKWTTLASVGQDIIEDDDGKIIMPHQWLEGNLPIGATCKVCNKGCGSMLRLRDWKCIWCRNYVHTQCRPYFDPACPLGPAKVSVVPPTALHFIQDEAWECVRPQASSPLLVFVNSKSGDNQGMKFLRKFKRLLNPAQVFDLITTGPRLGLRLFRHFDPFRILVCSGDGSVGWVLSEIDKLDMHRQCQVGVLPLGTGNDLARVLGWGHSCDADTHLDQLLTRYERARAKILDRWSIMIHERAIAMPKLSLVPGGTEDLHSQISDYETSLVDHIQKILQSDETSVVLSSAKRLCEIVKEFATQVSESSLIKGDEQLSKKCDILQQKLDLLLQTLTSEQFDATKLGLDDDESLAKGSSSNTKDDTESEMSYEAKTKPEKDLSNFNFRKHRRTSSLTSRFVEREKDALLTRANSLKRAIRNLVEHTEMAVDAQNRLKTEELDKANEKQKMDSLKVLPTIESTSASEVSSTASNGSIVTTRLVNISPMPDIRRESTCDDSDFLNLPAPPDFADSRRPSQSQNAEDNKTDELDKFLIETCNTLQAITKNAHKEKKVTEERRISLTLFATDNHEITKEFEKQRLYSKRFSKVDIEMDIEEEKLDKNGDDDKECSSMMSAISNEEISITSEIADQKSFCPRKNSDGDDVNGHICHIDSPETDTYPNSDALQGESLMDDISSMLGNDLCGYDSMDNTYTDDTTLFPSELSDMKGCKERRKSMKRDSLDRKRRSSRPHVEDEQFGFENRVFMTQHGIPSDQPKMCSLAQFVEGNDIARRSFKRGRPSVKITKNELNKQNTLTEESEGSLSSLNKSEKDEKDEETVLQFPQINVIVEPPSPDLNETIRNERMDKLSIEIEIEDVDQKLGGGGRLSASDMTSNNSSNSNLLGIDNEHFLSCSPAATRRISCCSMLNANETAILAAAATAKEKKDDKPEKLKEKEKKKLPIINPLVLLPNWPHVSSGAGFISKCLLANADTLCAAVSPLIDPEETLMEGFFERCVMNNYFGIGIDAKITLDFHNKREEYPEKCRSRAKNYMWYGVLGSKQWLLKSYKNLEQRVQLECDGQRIPLPSLQGIVVLNISSFMGGTNFWGGTKEDDIFLAPSIDDRILEVVAVFGSVQMAASRMINFQHHRIAQCQSVQINILGDEGIPVQVDGEAWIQAPGNIRIIHKNRMQVLSRDKILEQTLKEWEDKQKLHETHPGVKHRLSISHDRARTSATRQSMPTHEKSFLGVNIEKIRQHSFSGPVPSPTPIPTILAPPTVTFVDKPLSSNEPEILFNDEEHDLLKKFIECATTLVNWVKLIAISHSLEVDIYTLATKSDAALESIHPKGNWLTGPQLRFEFTKVVPIVRQLYDECCELFHIRSDKIRLREDLETQLHTSLANIELELRKLVMVDTANGTLAYLQAIPEHHNEHKRRSIFKLKFRSKSISSAAGPSGRSTRDVASWGNQEVASWLENLQLSEYTDSFIKNDIRGKELLTLARRDLKDLGVTKVGHVKRILQAVKDLKG